ncbi:MAG: hypothetical protein AB1430_02680 [Pseudomonadota bacterium]
MGTLPNALQRSEHDLLDRLKRIYPAVQEAGGSLPELAAAVGVPLADLHKLLSAAPEVVETLDAAHRSAEIEGKLLKPAAQRVVLGMLRHVQRALDAGQLDVDDVANLLPKAHRVIEHAEGTELKAGGGNLPMVHISIDMGGNVRAEVVDITPAQQLAAEIEQARPEAGAPGASPPTTVGADGVVNFAAILGRDEQGVED